MEIKNSLVCQIENCNNKALGVFNNKWICGLCLVKLENKIREQKKKFLDIIEKDLN